ncbi:MAG: peptide chain release factor N(5)-glutamine methyltransferase [Rhizobiaceae bacterium]|nr:peptide chain release factor N(5)-glutamine methyltransferase [Rhizobiaceae bacterium]
MAERTLGSVLRAARSALAEARIATPDLDARLIVEHFSGTSRADAIADPQRLLPPAIVDSIELSVARRLSGEPVHRILGFREFYGLRLALSPETLEPRPDTEILVDAVLPTVRDIVRKKGSCRILDLGTGTGAIALALLHEVPEAESVGVDISSEALETAVSNARRLGLDSRFSTRQGSWFEPVEGAFDVIVSNPPYVRRNDLPNLEREVRDFDPWAALDGGDDGLEAYRAIAEGVSRHLEARGMVAVEIGFDQAADVERVFAQREFVLAQKHRDLAQNDRVCAFIFA